MKKIALKKNLTSGIIAVIFGVVLWVMLPYCIKSGVNSVTSAVGPEYIPKIILAVTTACGIGLIFTSIVLKKDETVDIELKSETRALIYMVLLIVYVLLLPHIGYLISSMAFAGVSLLVMQCRKASYYIFAEILVVLIFIGFKYGLSVSLPTIWL